MKIRKRDICVMLVIVLVGFIIVKLSSTFAIDTQSYEGNNTVEGTNYKINITNVEDYVTTGEVEIINEISTFGTNLNFEILLNSYDASIEVEFTVTNQGKSSLMLVEKALSGLNTLDSENIIYELKPVDNIEFKTNETEGSIIKTNETQTFKLRVAFRDNINKNNFKETNLNLGLTLIYEEK